MLKGLSCLLAPCHSDQTQQAGAEEPESWWYRYRFNKGFYVVVEAVEVVAVNRNTGAIRKKRMKVASHAKRLYTRRQNTDIPHFKVDGHWLDIEEVDNRKVRASKVV